MPKPLKRDYRKHFTLASIILLLAWLLEKFLGQLMEANFQKIIEQKELDGYLAKFIGILKDIFNFLSPLLDNAYYLIFFGFLLGVAFTSWIKKKIKSKFKFLNQKSSENLPVKSTNHVSAETSKSILNVIAKYNQAMGNYVYNSSYPKDKTQQYQNDLEAEFGSLLAMREVMLDKDLEQLLRDIRQRIAIILCNAISVENSEDELRKKRSKGAISNREYMQEMPDLHQDFLKYKDEIIKYLKR